MTEENNENLDSLNEEGDVEPIESENNEPTEDVVALQEKIKEISDKNRQLFERAKKAEGFEKKDGKWIKAQKPEPKPEAKPELKPESQSNEPDYARLAFLKAEGVVHPDDQKIVQDEANRLKLPLTDVLQMEHIKSKLQDAKDQREAQAGMPRGHHKGSGKSQQDVDYWINQENSDGTYKTPDDQELAEKVIEERIKKETEGSKFGPIRV